MSGGMILLVLESRHEEKYKMGRAKYKKNISVTAYVIPTRRNCTMSHVS
jgi:hypothetical protein